LAAQGEKLTREQLLIACVQLCIDIIKKANTTDPTLFA